MEPVEDRKDAYNRGVEAQENGTWWVWIPAVADSHTDEEQDLDPGPRPGKK
jgi:hypothetical protein